MTITKIFQIADYVADRFLPVVGIICLALPLIAAIVFRLIHGKGRGGETPWKYLYSFLAFVAVGSGLYWATIPTYITLFTEEKCPDVRTVWFYWPAIVAILTLILIARTVRFDSLPGLKRFYFFIPIILVSLVVPLKLEKGELIEMSLYKYLAIAFAVWIVPQGIAWRTFGRVNGKPASPPEVPTPQ